jgi:sarcosine oxidase, subunit beta
MSTAYDLVVIGGGVHGATVALFAARGGMRVAIIERDQICRGASGVNAGTLTMQMTRIALIPYAMKAHAMWASATEWLGHDVGVVVCDGLSLAFTEGEEELLTYRAGKRREAGAPIEMLTGARAREIEPGLSPDVRSAGWCKVDGYANAYLTGLAYRRALVDAGVTVLEQYSATGIEVTGSGYTVMTSRGAISGTRLLIAGGVWIEPMLAWIGVKVPIKVLINQLSVTERVVRVFCRSSSTPTVRS